MDLADFYRGELSVRRLSVLVEGLPPEALTWARRSGVPHGWTFTPLLLADLFQAWTGQPHPARPQPEGGKSSRYARLRARLEAQKARLGSSPP